MRFLAFILIWVSVGVGVVTATTAYLWVVPREGGHERFEIGTTPGGEPRYAVLAADAGGDPGGEPVALTGTPLTPDVVERLQAAGVERVKVKEFVLGRWTGFPLFVAACVGLIAGAILTRLSTARAVRLAEQGRAEADVLTPAAAIAELRTVTRSLLDDAALPGDEEQACGLVTRRLGEALRDFVPAITEARDRLVARMGLGGYAVFMDAFGAAERSLNRAWSAAADNHLAEAIESLDRAGERLAVAEGKLSGRTPSLPPLV